MYVDQYCSCSISIAYRFMSGSLRMPCVRSLLLCKLFCNISSCVMVMMSGDEIVDSVVIPLALSFVDGLDIRGTMRSVSLCNLRITSFHFDIPLFHAPAHIFHILLSSFIHSPCAHMPGI